MSNISMIRRDLLRKALRKWVKRLVNIDIIILLMLLNLLISWVYKTHIAEISIWIVKLFFLNWNLFDFLRCTWFESCWKCFVNIRIIIGSIIEKRRKVAHPLVRKEISWVHIVSKWRVFISDQLSLIVLLIWSFLRSEVANTIILLYWTLVNIFSYFRILGFDFSFIILSKHFLDFLDSLVGILSFW